MNTINRRPVFVILKLFLVDYDIVGFQITRIAMTSSSWVIEHKLLLDFEYFRLNLCYARMGWSHMLVKDVNSNIICISQLHN